jgi:hypothetical protein
MNNWDYFLNISQIPYRVVFFMHLGLIDLNTLPDTWIRTILRESMTLPTFLATMNGYNVSTARVVSLINNSIVDVKYTIDNIKNENTVIR